MRHVIGPVEAKGEVLDVTFLLNSEVNIPEVRDEVVHVNEAKVKNGLASTSGARKQTKCSRTQKLFHKAESRIMAQRCPLLFHDIPNPLFITGDRGIELVVHCLKGLGLFKAGFGKRTRKQGDRGTGRHDALRV